MAAVDALRPLVVGPIGRGPRGRPGRLLARSRRRQPAALDRAREGRHPPRDRGRRQCRLGPRGKAGGRAGLAAPQRDVAGRDRRARRFPLPDRRPDARPRRSSCSNGRCPGRREREAELLRDGYPAYTTSVGWLGYDDDKIRRLCREALADGWTRFKMKVGADVEDDVRRMRIIRDEIGPDRMLAVDANQRWDVGVGHRLDGAARAVRPVLDRGADQPRRHPRPRGDRPRRGAHPGRHRRARPQPDHVQAVPGGRRARASARSTPAGSVASTRSSRSCCWPPSSG